MSTPQPWMDEPIGGRFRSRGCYNDFMTTTTKPITAEELLAMGDIGRCELIYGEIHMMSPSGAAHGVVAMRFARYLGQHVEDNDLGLVFGAETGFRVESDPDLVRAPDAAFVRKERVGGEVTRKFWPGVPDLAVEVLSPEDTKRAVAEKINMWLAHGTAVVWQADPTRRMLTIHRTGQPAEVLSMADTLKGEPLLPGFELPLEKIFRLP